MADSACRPRAIGGVCEAALTAIILPCTSSSSQRSSVYHMMLAYRCASFLESDLFRMSRSCSFYESSALRMLSVAFSLIVSFFLSFSVCVFDLLFAFVLGFLLIQEFTVLFFPIACGKRVPPSSFILRQSSERVRLNAQAFFTNEDDVDVLFTNEGDVPRLLANEHLFLGIQITNAQFG